MKKCDIDRIANKLVASKQTDAIVNKLSDNSEMIFKKLTDPYVSGKNMLKGWLLDCEIDSNTENSFWGRGEQTRYFISDVKIRKSPLNPIPFKTIISVFQAYEPAIKDLSLQEQKEIVKRVYTQDSEPLGLAREVFIETDAGVVDDDVDDFGIWLYAAGIDGGHNYVLKLLGEDKRKSLEKKIKEFIDDHRDIGKND